MFKGVTQDLYNLNMVNRQKLQKDLSSVSGDNYPYYFKRRRYQRRRYKLYRPIKTSTLYSFDYILRFPINTLSSHVTSTSFLSYSLKGLLTSSSNWDSVASLWSYYKVTYVKIVGRTLISPKYFKTYPCLALNFLPSDNTLISTYNTLAASNNAKIWQLEKNFFVGSFNLYNYVSSNQFGVARYASLNHAFSGHLGADALGLQLIGYFNMDFLFDLQRGTTETGDDLSQTLDCVEFSIRIWVRFRNSIV